MRDFMFSHSGLAEVLSPLRCHTVYLLAFQSIMMLFSSQQAVQED